MIPSFTQGPRPASRGDKRIDPRPQLDEPFDSQPRACCEPCRASNILAHSGRDQGECPVGLHHDQMALAGETLAVLDLHHLSGPRMERIEDQNLERRPPGIVTLSRPASTLGHKAYRDNRSVLYQRVPRLFDELALARGDGRHPRLLRALGRVDLLILDDWGLAPLDAGARHDLLEVLEDRYGRRSLP
ncbi:hypothetical protein ABIC02_007446 [Bradyrhizobium sp. RT5a]